MTEKIDTPRTRSERTNSDLPDNTRNADTVSAALAGVDAAKRTTLARLIGGSAFVAPILASFAMDGLTIANPILGGCPGNATIIGGCSSIPKGI
jgi:hypothetical protein